MKSRAIFSLCVIVCLALALNGPAQVGQATQMAEATPTPSAAISLPREWQAMSSQNQMTPHSALVIAPATALAADSFGYAWSEASHIADWKDLSADVSATQVFTQTDDDILGPIPLTFAFDFYENQYSQVYLNANGMLTFGAGRADRDNVAIPQEPLPNDFIAPLWSDLAMGTDYGNPGGAVYYKAGSDAQGAYFAVEWHGVTGRYTAGQLTFAVILRQNGDIQFLYHSITNPPAELTIGIEDGDGQDGLTYLHNLAGLTGPKTIFFDRPNPASRGKLLPRLQGGFTQNHQAAFLLTVRNTGDAPALPADTFNLSVNTSVAGWSASLWVADGSAPLTDSDSDGRPDSGPLAQGADFTFLVKIAAERDEATPLAAPFAVVAQSKNNPQHTVQAHLQSAPTSPFIQAFSDNLGLHAENYGTENATTTAVDSWFGGSNMSLSPLRNHRYAFSWERNHDKIVGNRPILYSDAEFALLDALGRVVRPTTLLTDNRDVTLSTFDLSPMVVATHDTLGAIWIHQVFDPAKGINANIYFRRLQADGTLLDSAPTNVTNNTQWRGEGTLNVPVFFSPRLLSTHDNRFVLTWFDEQSPSLGSTISNIWMAIFDNDGLLVLPPTQLTNSTANNVLFSYPAITLLDTNFIFMVYTVFDNAANTQGIAYAVINSNGQFEKTETPLAGSAGTRADVSQIGDGHVLLAWTDTRTAQIAYAMLDDADFSVMAAPQSLTNPDPIPHPADFVSVTPGAGGDGILTWMDRRWSRHLYYAQVDPQGNLVVEPMIFITGADANVLVQTSFTGYGNAPRSYSSIFLPVIHR
jgi:hypothetical protein